MGGALTLCFWSLECYRNIVFVLQQHFKSRNAHSYATNKQSGLFFLWTFSWQHRKKKLTNHFPIQWCSLYEEAWTAFMQKLWEQTNLVSKFVPSFGECVSRKALCHFDWPLILLTLKILLFRSSVAKTLILITPIAHIIELMLQQWLLTLLLQHLCSIS